MTGAERTLKDIEGNIERWRSGQIMATVALENIQPLMRILRRDIDCKHAQQERSKIYPHHSNVWVCMRCEKLMPPGDGDPLATVRYGSDA